MGRPLPVHTVACAVVLKTVFYKFSKGVVPKKDGEHKPKKPAAKVDAEAWC